MDESFLISVIVPVYNPPADGLRTCIESILTQTISRFELILVDDGSSGEIAAILFEYAQKEARLRLVSQRNMGVSAARNAGLQCAAGTYVAFVDADDFVEKDYLERMLVAIQGCELCICSVSGERVINEETLSAEEFFTDPELHCALAYLNYSVNKLYLNRIIKNESIAFREDVRLGEDALFLADYLRHSVRIACVSAVLYHYVRYCTSSLNRFCADYWMWELTVIHRQFELFAARSLLPKQQVYLYKWLIMKFKGVFFYYLAHKEGESYFSTVFREVFRDSLLQIALQHSREISLFTKERVITFLWKNAGVSGVAASYRICTLIKRMKRLSTC